MNLDSSSIFAWSARRIAYFQTLKAPYYPQRPRKKTPFIRHASIVVEPLPYKGLVLYPERILEMHMEMLFIDITIAG